MTQGLNSVDLSTLLHLNTSLSHRPNPFGTFRPLFVMNKLFLQEMKNGEVGREKEKQGSSSARSNGQRDRPNDQTIMK